VRLDGQVFSWLLRARHTPRGVIVLSFEDDRHGGRRRKSEHSSEGATSSAVRSKRKKKAVETPEIGQALRSIYDRALNESIPDEMLDLLGKLG